MGVRDAVGTQGGTNHRHRTPVREAYDPRCLPHVLASVGGRNEPDPPRESLGPLVRVRVVGHLVISQVAEGDGLGLACVDSGYGAATCPEELWEDVADEVRPTSVDIVDKMRAPRLVSGEEKRGRLGFGPDGPRLVQKEALGSLYRLADNEEGFGGLDGLETAVLLSSRNWRAAAFPF